MNTINSARREMDELHASIEGVIELLSVAASLTNDNGDLHTIAFAARDLLGSDKILGKIKTILG
ncbi:hypothetical protein FACS1894111_10380 [Clostridia bacterium]|nr:hypothetical protein FACS1894111_10380 [Clostridia bacterium]